MMRALAAGAICLLLCGCVAPADEKPLSASNFQLDTIVTVTIYDGGKNVDEGIFQDVFAEIDRYEKLLSADTAGSDPYRLAEHAGTGYVEVSEDTLFLLEQSQKFSELSDGAFDCTVGPLVSLWNISGSSGHYPTRGELERTLALISYRDILRDGDRVMLKNAGMKVTFGAIAKGYIADRVKDMLAARGVTSAIINLGGNILLLGAKPDGTPFNVGIRNPVGEDGEYFAVIEATDKSLVSSGVYERFFVHDGKKYHHILDPKTGFPAENELAGVTIISDSSTDGDGFSTTALLLGLTGGLELINASEGVEAVFVTHDRKVWLSDGIGPEFTIINDEFSLGASDL